MCFPYRQQRVLDILRKSPARSTSAIQKKLIHVEHHFRLTPEIRQCLADVGKSENNQFQLVSVVHFLLPHRMEKTHWGMGCHGVEQTQVGERTTNILVHDGNSKGS